MLTPIRREWIRERYAARKGLVSDAELLEEIREYARELGATEEEIEALLMEFLV